MPENDETTQAQLDPTSRLKAVSTLGLDTPRPSDDTMLLDQARVEAVIATAKLKDARRFYEDVVGLRPVGNEASDAEVVYALAGDSKLVLYEHGEVAAPAHTVAHFVVPDVEATVAELRGRGVQFDEYDLPTLKTIDGIATVNGSKFAWFHDVDFNVIGIHD